jgi:hypothetical protein
MPDFFYLQENFIAKKCSDSDFGFLTAQELFYLPYPKRRRLI